MFDYLIAKYNMDIKRSKEDYLLARSQELVDIFGEGDLRKYYEEVKKTFGNHVNKYVPGITTNTSGLKTKDGRQSLTTDKEILERWQEHFSLLFNQESTVADNIEDYLPEQQADRLCGGKIIEAEIREAIKTLKVGKAPGEDTTCVN